MSKLTAMLALLLLALSARAQDVLTAEAVLESSRTHFPSILKSLAERRGAVGKALEAAGAFDLVFEADGFSRLSGFYDGSVIAGKATQRLRPLGASIYGGYQLSDGDFPIYEDEAFTSRGGQLKVGALFSLLRNRDIDDERFGLTDAELAIRQADLDVLLTKVGVQQRALIAYWSWVTAGRQLEVYEDLLRIALGRESGLEEQVRSGARAAIFLVENQQYITRRQRLATAARRDFAIATNALSYYYRDENGAPIEPSRERLPPVDPLVPAASLKASIESSTSSALDRRPELAILRTAIDRARNRIELAENSQQPLLDLNLEVATGLGDEGEGGPSRDTTDTIVGFEFSVPFQRREAKGRIAQEQAKVEAIRQEQRLREDQIMVEVKNILLDLNVSRQLLTLAAQEVDQSEQVRKAEQRRFESGASDFFVVNVREETEANARIQHYQADLNQRIARANYDAATVNLARLGIEEESAAGQ
ncbi:MAG: TolC family protein [Gammaproteobacteria bacterium]|jgi:outer membrane protein TolC